MIHPHPGDTVPVCDEVADAVADDGGIGTVGTYAAEIRHDHFPYIIRFHKEQGQTVLPQVTPASSAPAVIVIRQEGTAVDPAKEGLEGHPGHKVVKIGISGMEMHIYLILPVFTGYSQCSGHIGVCTVGCVQPADLIFILLCTDPEDVDTFLSRGQSLSLKFKATHGFSSGDLRTGWQTFLVQDHGFGAKEASAFTDEALCCGEEALCLLSVSFRSVHIIDQVIQSVPLLIKGHGGLHLHPFLRNTDAVQHGGYIPMIPEVIRRTSVKGDHCHGREYHFLIGCIPKQDPHDLHICIHRNKGSHFRFDAVLLRSSHGLLPQETAFDPAFLLGIGKALRFLLCRASHGGPYSAAAKIQPEIPRVLVVVQILHTHGFKHEMFLIQLGIPAQIRRHAGLQPRLTGDGKV